MIRRIARLMAAEVLKLSGHPFLYLSFGILAVAVVLAEVLQPVFLGQKETEWRSLHALQLYAYGFSFGLKIATFVLLIFSSMLFAGEFDRGTIKNLLTRPVRRGEIFAAKGVTAAALALGLYLFVLYVALFTGLLRGEMGPVWDDTEYLVQREYAEIAGHAVKATLMGFLPFLAAGFLGLLVSNLTESSGYAVAAALVIYLFGDLLTGMLGDRAQQRVFLHYAPYAMEKLRLYAEGSNTRWDPKIDERLLYVTVPLAWMAGFIPAAFAIFRSRNVHA